MYDGMRIAVRSLVSTMTAPLFNGISTRIHKNLEHGHRRLTLATFFATSDTGSVIKIWNDQHFAPVYQLSCDNGITDIYFSPNFRCIYDLNGVQCNVWEPNVLIWLTETEERASERESEAGSASQFAFGSEAYAETADPVNAFYSPTSTKLYCADHDAGIIQLCDLKGN